MFFKSKKQAKDESDKNLQVNVDLEIVTNIPLEIVSHISSLRSINNSDVENIVLLKHL